MTVTVLAVAKNMGERSEWTLTNLALQKLSYIAHMMHLGRHGEPLVYGNFQAWDWGPVHPQLYHAARRFGAGHVNSKVFRSVRLVHDEPAAPLINKVVDSLSDNTARLIKITHWEKGAWAKHYVPSVRGITIPNSDILQEFEDRKVAPQR